MLNLSVILEDSARRYPDKEAFIFGDTRLTFSQVNAAANQVANGLVSSGIKPGDHVALSCLNLPYFPIVYFGILKAGAAVVPLSVLLKSDEIDYHLNDADAKAYFCFQGTEELPMGEMGYAGFKNADQCSEMILITAKPTDPSPIDGLKTLGQLMKDQTPQFESVQSSETDTALIVYTSGTTGRPKGAELTHSNILHNTILSTNLLHLKPDDVSLIVLPLFHIFGQVVQMNANIYQGITSVLVPKFDAHMVFSLMLKEKVTQFAGVPTMYWGLLNYDNAQGLDMDIIADQLRVCVSGGASLPVQVLKDFESKYKVDILEGYGMSEGSPVVTFNQFETGRKPGSVGKPVWGVEVDAVDEYGKSVGVDSEGQVVYRGHNVMKGYYKKPDATKETIKNGWLQSGDVGKIDEEGFLYIVDRTKDMIIRGGFNVYPREVEEIIIKHEAVSLVAVIGIKDEQYGEEIKACVVLNQGASISEDELINWTKDQIAAYKYPRVIEFMDVLPMTATGKILKKELRKRELELNG